jgi:hypothetical protein
LRAASRPSTRSRPAKPEQAGCYIRSGFGYGRGMNEREDPGLEPDDEQTTSPHGDELEEALEEDEEEPG